MKNKKYTDRMKEIVAGRFPDAHAVTKVVSPGQDFEWQSNAQKFIKPEKDVIFAWSIDGQGETSFRFYRVPTTMLEELLQGFMKKHPELGRTDDDIRDHRNTKHPYKIVHITRGDLEERGLKAQILE